MLTNMGRSRIVTAAFFTARTTVNIATARTCKRRDAALALPIRVKSQRENKFLARLTLHAHRERPMITVDGVATSQR